MLKSSCLIPCHNAYPHLKLCLETALPEFDEVILFLDGCTDKSKLQANEFSDRPNLQIITSSEKIGVQAARNRLYEASSGDILNFFDADDYRIPGVLPGLISVLNETHDNNGFIVTPFKGLHRNPFYKSEVYEEFIPDWMSQDWTGETYPEIWYLLATRNIQTGGVLWKRSCLEAIRSVVGSVWDETRIGLQDVHLVLDALQLGFDGKAIPTFSHYYRWGWSKNQVTVWQGRPYREAALKFLKRLENCCPAKWQLICCEEHELLRLLTEEIAHESEHNLLPLDFIQPCFD